jgi:hypothetical protein
MQPAAGRSNFERREVPANLPPVGVLVDVERDPVELAVVVAAEQVRGRAVDPASAERIGLFRAFRIVARVRTRDATRPLPEVPSVALVTEIMRGVDKERRMNG